MTYIYIYDVYIPSNIEIFLEELVKLIEFHTFDPEELIKQFIDPEFTLKDWLLGSEGTLASNQFFESLGVWFWILIATFFLICDLSLIAIIPRCRKVATNHLKRF